MNGQTLHYDPMSVASNTDCSRMAESRPDNLLQRYYGGSLPACRDAAYTTPTEPLVTPGMCGWTNSIAYRGDDQNTEFDALQVTLAQKHHQGACVHGELPVGQRIRRDVELLHLEPLDYASARQPSAQSAAHDVRQL